MAIALGLNRGISHDASTFIEFPVIDIASAIGWNSGVVKYQLKNLEWTTGKRLMLEQSETQITHNIFSIASGRTTKAHNDLSRILRSGIQSAGTRRSDRRRARCHIGLAVFESSGTRVEPIGPGSCRSFPWKVPKFSDFHFAFSWTTCSVD